jgi:hypothetical protein
MAVDGRYRRIKGAIGNAFAFAVCWSIAAFILWFPLRQLGILPKISILSGVGIAIRIGVMGFITGAAFPSIMRVAYRGKHLAEISWVRFGIVAGIITGLFVPTFMETMSVLTGGGIVPFSLIRLDIIWCAVLGAIAAALSLKIAQYAERRLPETFQDHLDRLERTTLLASGVQDLPVKRQARSVSDRPE